LTVEEKQRLKDAVKAARRRIKADSIEYKGGKCRICGYDRCDGALQFHHLDPSKKDFQISSGN